MCAVQVNEKTNAGARNWSQYVGRTFCKACFLYFAQNGSFAGRESQQSMAGGNRRDGQTVQGAQQGAQAARRRQQDSGNKEGSNRDDSDVSDAEEGGDVYGDDEQDEDDEDKAQNPQDQQGGEQAKRVKVHKSAAGRAGEKAESAQDAAACEAADSKAKGSGACDESSAPPSCSCCTSLAQFLSVRSHTTLELTHKHTHTHTPTRVRAHTGYRKCQHCGVYCHWTQKCCTKTNGQKVIALTN